MAKVASGQTMRSAARLLQVLKCFGGQTSRLSITDISQTLNLAPATVRRLLGTLEEEGFLRQSEAGGRYELHYEVIRLAAAALAGSSLVKIASPILDDLRDRLGEASTLLVRDGPDLIVIDHRQSSHLVKMFHSIGYRYPAYRGSAAGKAMLAWLPEAELRVLLPASGRWEPPTERGIADFEALRVALEQTRVRGYGLNEGETEAEVWSVAFPVRDHHDRPVAAINMPCPTRRLSDDRRSMIIAALRKAAHRLSAAAPFAA